MYLGYTLFVRSSSVFYLQTGKSCFPWRLLHTSRCRLPLRDRQSFSNHWSFRFRSTGQLQGATTNKRNITGLRHEIARLLGLAKPEKWRLTGAICLLFMTSAVTMAVPFSIGKIIDIIYTSDAESTMEERLVYIAKVLVVIFVLGAATNCGRVYLMQTSGYRITQRLRMSVFSSIIKQEVAFFDKSQTGELVNRLSADTILVGSSLSTNISDSLRNFVSIIAGVSMMFYMSTKLAMIGLATVPPVAILSVFYGRYIRRMTASVQDGLAQSTQVAQERISNIRTVRAFGRESSEVFYYKMSLDRVLGLMYQESLARGIFFGFTGLSGNLIVLSVLYYGGLMVTKSSLTVGDLSAFLLYAAYVGISFSGLSSAYSEIMKGLGASTRLWEIVDRQPDIPISSGMVPSVKVVGDVVFDNVSFAYPLHPDIAVFDKLSLWIPAGKITAIVGASGSGKSTLAHLILRFYDSNCGQILFDGHDIRDLNPAWLRCAIGTVSQEPVLFSCSIRDNIMYGAADDRQTIADCQLVKVCEEANAWGFISNFPKKLDTMVGERGLTLSGGQKQRIVIARALLRASELFQLFAPFKNCFSCFTYKSSQMARAYIEYEFMFLTKQKNPRILLLDEATSALDAESEHQVQQALERVMSGRTVLTIAHRLSTIRRANQIAVLANGHIAELGSYDTLVNIPGGIFSKLIQRQTILVDGLSKNPKV